MYENIKELTIKELDSLAMDYAFEIVECECGECFDIEIAFVESSN